MYCNFWTNHFYKKSQITVSCPHHADYVDFPIWDSSEIRVVQGKQMTPKLLNGAFLGKKHDCKRFFHVMVNPYIPIFWDLEVHGGRTP